MDLLNNAYAPAVEIFRGLTPAARIASATVTIVILVSLVFLFHQQVGATDTYLMGGEMFSAAQLRDMQAAFGKAGLEAQIDGARVKIPRGQESKYMAALADSGALPQEFGDYLNKAVNGTGYFGFRQQQDAAIKVARQRELQNILNHLPGVEKSAVQIDEQVERGLNPKKIVTASVNIVTRPSQPLDDARVRTIRFAVASSVAGLKPEAVTVIDLGAARPFPGTGGADSVSGTAAGDYADYKKRLELDWQEKIAAALYYIPGILVRTNVELDQEITNEETSIQVDVPTANRTPNAASSEKTSDASLAHAVSRAIQHSGLAPATPNVASSDADADTRRAVPGTRRHIVREGRTPKRVTVSIAVPAVYYQDVWRKQNPSANLHHQYPHPTVLAEIEAAERKSIAAAVAALLPQSGDAYPQIAVTTFHPAVAPRMPDAPPRDRAMVWVEQNWQPLGLAGLVLAGLMMLHSMFTARPAPAAAPQNAPADIAELPAEPVVPDVETRIDAAEPVLAKRRHRGAPLHEELADIVRDDPDAAIGVLRSWIGNPS